MNRPEPWNPTDFFFALEEMKDWKPSVTWVGGSTGYAGAAEPGASAWPTAIESSFSGEKFQLEVGLVSNQEQTMPEPPACGGPMPLEEIAERAPRIARSLFRGKDRDFIDEVCQRALVNLFEVDPRKLTIAYVWKTIKNEGLNYLRELARKREEGLDDHQIPLRPAPKPDLHLAPAVVTSARLRAVNESGPVEAIAFGYRIYLGYSANDIALNLAAISLEDLARGLIEKCARASRLEETQLSRAFPALLSIMGTADGARTLQDLWKPELVVQKWIADVESEIWPSDGVAVSADAVPELSRATPKPPNRRIAFAFGSKDGLDCRIPRIISDCGNMTLESLQVDFEDRYPGRTPAPRLALDTWKPVIRMQGKAAERELQSYYTPGRTVGAWIEKTFNALEGEDLRQEKHGLREIFTCERYRPHEAMAMLYTREGFLAASPRDVWEEFAHGDCAQMEASLRERYGKRWGFDEEQVKRWFAPLREKLDGSQHVTRFFPDPPSIRSAQVKVSNIIQRWFGKGKESPLFGWRHKLL